MKKIIIGTLVGTLLYFGYQSVMWMGQLHQDFNSYTGKQDAVMRALNDNLPEDGLYMLPAADPNSPNRQEESEKLMQQNIGKPWAMIFYHKSMQGMEPSYLLMGVFYTLIACLITSMVLYYGSFPTFFSRFLVAMSFAFFALSQGVLDDMNWWGYPWKFVQAQVVDLTLGWAICSAWLGWYVKK